MSGIFLVKDDTGDLVEMTEQDYDSEGVLQTLLAKYPNLLAGDQVDGAIPREWLLVSREAGVPCQEGGADRWSVDHVFLDQDGIPTLIEVKRACDTRIRREVVGQMLDYGANAVSYWSIDAVRSRFALTSAASGTDPDAMLINYLNGRAEPDEYWEKVKTNLEAGRIRMVFVADQIPAELLRVIEFLNLQMNPAEVIGLEIKQFAGTGLRTFVPRVLGQTAVGQVRKTGAATAKRQWDEKSFMEEIETRKGSADRRIVEELLSWAKQQELRIWWGQGGKDASFRPMLDRNAKPYWTFAVYTYGRLEVLFQHIGTTAVAGARQALLAKLNGIPGVQIPEDAVEGRPSIPLSTLSSAGALRQFMEAMDWYLAVIRAEASAAEA